LLGCAGTAHAQLLPQLKFELSHPGARSLAFAGAFAALADDATAAYANPAGLVQLTRTEISLEGRYWKRPDFFLIGDVGTFASVVYPRGRWTFAMYSQRLTTFEWSSDSRGLFRIGEAPLDARDDVDLRLSAVSAAAAFRVDDSLSVGLALVQGHGHVQGKRDVFVQGASPPPGFLPIDPARLLATGQLAIDDSDLTLSTGVWWSPSERFAAGAFFRQGARFEGTGSFTERPRPGGTPATRETSATFAAPDVLGAGGAYHLAGGRVTLAAEVDRVGYDGLVRAGTRSDLDGLTRQYRDSWQYRLGVEYAYLASRPVVALRAGTWVDSASNERQLRQTTHFAAGVGIAAKHVQVDVGVDLAATTDTGSLSLIYSF
jgi:long-subunit fatty acid transport protein